MKITVDATSMKKALELVRPGDHRSPHDPITSGVHIEARGKGVLQITTTDLACWESVKVTGQVVDEPGSVLLAWKSLRRIMAAMKGDEVVIEVDDNGKAVLTSGELIMGIGARKQHTFEGPITPQFPATPAVPKSATPLKLHVGALREVSRFASPDQARPILTSVYYDRGTYVATDSYRLATVSVPEHATDLKFLIPPRAMSGILRLAPEKFIDAWVSEDGRMLWVHAGDAVIASELMWGEFPGYQSLFPEATKDNEGARITMEIRDASLKMYRLLQACGYDGRHGSTLKISPTDKGVALFSQIDENTIEIKALGMVETPVAFNPHYFVDFFEGTNVDTMFGGDSLRPWGLEEETGYCVGSIRKRLIMPVRITEAQRW